ncbi:MAG: hypothetical protein MI919_31905 [Holophagales bacterium]|nr:hypothetical protein [Holophagales bacterium]
MSKRRPTVHSTSGRSRRPFRGQRMRDPRTPEDNVRVAAAWVLERTLDTLAPSTVYLESALERLDEPDHGLLRELALGSLRWLRRLDHVIEAASDRRMERIDPALRAPLRIGAYQLLFLDRIPAHAAVHEAVEHARRATHRGGASFTNAVLRRIARDASLDAWPVHDADPIRRLAIEKSHPDFLVRRFLDQLGRRRAEALLDANNRPKALQLLAFRDRGGRELLAEELIEHGVDVEPSSLSPQGLIVRQGNPFRSEAYRRGAFYVQDEASQAAALVPPPVAGETILDAAAAPGGKAFTLAACEPGVRLLLADVSPKRSFTLGENLRRLGRALPMTVADAGCSPFATTFDRVVLDLPCSGTGTVRKHPELKWRISESEIGRLSRQALRLLRGMTDRVRAGGRLVAITCSLEPEENESIVGKFLGFERDFVLEPLEDLLDYPSNRAIMAPGAWRLLPEADHDGFTVHVMRRRGG